MSVRQVISIDEELCDGCGDCVLSCAEGAIQVIDGKARLVSDVYCDGLGACLGECPTGALSIQEREAGDFDTAAVEKHLAKPRDRGDRHGHGPITKEAVPSPAGPASRSKAAVPETREVPHSHGGHVCPGSALRSFDRSAAPQAHTPDEAGERPSAIRNWPVQLSLLPVKAPFFQGADLLIAADCVPFAMNGFHERLLEGKVLVIGCPKLDNAEFYARKLADIFRENEVRSVHVAFMEVPCCMGLVHLVEQAITASGKPIPLSVTRVGVRGEIQQSADRIARPQLGAVRP